LILEREADQSFHPHPHHLHQRQNSRTENLHQSGKINLTTFQIQLHTGLYFLPKLLIRTFEANPLITVNRYELPPPSRPKENTVNIFDPNYKVTTTHQMPIHNNNLPQASHQYQQVYQTLVPVYVKPYGIKYYLVPTNKWNYLANNLVDDYSHEKYNKYNEKLMSKYNLKSKKYYKTYDKSVPKSFVSFFGKFSIFIFVIYFFIFSYAFTFEN
jgi:hypothetical protein